MDLEQALARIAEQDIKINHLTVENQRIVEHKNKLLDEKKQATERLRELEKYSTEEVEDLIQFKQEAVAEKAAFERKRLEEEGKYKELAELERQKYQQELAAAQAKLQQEKETEAQRAKRLEEENLKLKLENPILSALATISDFPSQIFKLNQDNFALNDTGKPVFRDGLTDIPIKEWVESIGNKPDLAHFVRASGARGGGAPPGGSGGGRTVTTGNPFARGADFNLTKQGELMRSNPAEAARLKKEAHG